MHAEQQLGPVIAPGRWRKDGDYHRPGGAAAAALGHPGSFPVDAVGNRPVVGCRYPSLSGAQVVRFDSAGSVANRFHADSIRDPAGWLAETNRPGAQGPKTPFVGPPG